MYDGDASKNPYIKGTIKGTPKGFIYQKGTIKGTPKGFIYQKGTLDQYNRFNNYFSIILILFGLTPLILMAFPSLSSGIDLFVEPLGKTLFIRIITYIIGFPLLFGLIIAGIYLLRSNYRAKKYKELIFPKDLSISLKTEKGTVCSL